MSETQPVKPLVPAIRFKGFTDAWEQRKLKNVLKVNSGRDYKNLKPGNIPVYGTGGFMLNVNGQLSSDDAIGIGRKGTIDRPQFLKAPFWTVDTLFFMTSEGNNSLRFLYAWCQLVQWKRYDESTGVPSLSKSTLNKITLKVPSLSEQNSAGEFFNILDNLIASNQRRGEILKELKKALLQKMFVSGKKTVPDIRFSGYTDAWEQRKLADLATIDARIGWQNLRTSEFLSSGNYMLITGTDFRDGAINYAGVHYVQKERYDQDEKIQIKNGSILITKDGTLGKVAYVKDLLKPATLNAGVFNVEVKDRFKTNNKYLFHYLKAPFLLNFASKQSTGGTIKHLNKNVLVKFLVPLPIIQEQERIGVFLSALENLIASNQRKGEILKSLKKVLLQKMFV
ncbi:restriction endonuclease subunit S [Levilactobacillus acidifarinae]|uniref:Type I restriction-modification system specificity subunit n=1 Tax=Levilactobacillus acidifarinae DSM 19394 = JCM 15949 TaxID=1423715 RepID=A0A0R1LR59_9LACO|nr:restriction endonuclease subunit S [Levilactobacillus acidifarinae]KRK95636.1 type I restriction-modification system specificity subunit [Levilactobacillus acidifarinae DSM 19394]GEO69371.1 restriction endonuclease subunit S [Levilactobacillus acidifarinae]